MNQEHTAFHLSEALEELSRTTDRCRTDPNYSEAELFVAMQHLYHHLNTAWNGRGISAERMTQCTDEDFNALGAFPTDLPPLSV